MSSKILAGRYELFEKIGEGGMSVVYKAMDKMLNRYVAIKILKPDFISDTKFIESFRRESRAAASLAHPNIVSIFDVGQEGNIHYIVMELIDGKTLSDVIRETGPLPYQRVIEMTKQIAGALSLAHQKQIIHRDIKPHNILITPSGTAKITDFGIAKAVNAATIVENTGEGVIGSVHYFSPEQARGGYVDEKSDLYSLGIVMYEMLTGRVPFDGDNPVNIALMHINSQMVRPSQLISGIPPALERIVLKASDKNPINRFTSAQELIEALNNLQFVGNVVGNSVFMGANGAGNLADPNRPMVDTDFDDGEDEDDENDDKKDKKKMSTKKKIIIAVCAVAVLVLALTLGLVFGLFGGGTTVPDLSGYTFKEAQLIAEKSGFKVEKGEKVFDDEMGKGKVASQDPPAGSKAKEGSVITVFISKGAQKGNVPDVIDKEKDEAIKILEDAGFKVETSTEPGDKPKDVVMDQTPKGGETAKAGSTVKIILSDGSQEKGNVPYLLSKSESQAKTAIEEAGYKVGNVSYVNNDKYPKDQVCWQEYPGGQDLPKGTAISIKISKGPAGPGSVTIYVDFSAAKAEVFYMTVTVSDDNGTRNVVSNQQRNKSEGGTYVKVQGQGKGIITVIFDGKQVKQYQANFNSGKVT